MTNFRNAMMAAAHTASGVPVVSVGNSALFDDGNSEYLSRTPSGAGNLRKWTLSLWAYRCDLGTGEFKIWSAISGSNFDMVAFTGNQLGIEINTSTSSSNSLRSTALFRDQGWYHIVVVWDSDNAISTNRIRAWVNGERITSWGTSNFPGSAGVDSLTNSTVLHTLGAKANVSQYFDGYLAESVLIDGLALEPTSFAEYDSTGTFWTPLSSATIKALTFGTNGYYLDNTTNAQTDASGNGNNFTNNNTVTLSTHTPTNLNALFNPLNFLDITTRFPVMTVGNTTTGFSTSGSSATGGLTFPVTYNTHIEFIFSVAAASGFDHQYPTFKVFPFNGPYDTALVRQPSGNFANDAGLASGATRPNFANGDRITMEIDASNGRIYLWQNGSALNSANPGANSGFTFDYTPPASGAVILAFTNGNSTSKTLVNSNPADFEDTVSAGYFPLTSTAITAQTTRTKSNLEEYFDSTLYEGNGAGQRVGKFLPFTNSFTVGNSALFDYANNEILKRTNSSGGNETKWTFSTWVKFNNFDAAQIIFGSNAPTISPALWIASNNLYFTLYNGDFAAGGGSYVMNLITDIKLYDTSQWMNIVAKYDSTPSTPSASSIALYLNGVQITNFSTESYPSQNQVAGWNSANEMIIGTAYNNHLTTQNLRAYLAETVNIDGLALEPSSFGQVDTSTGRWIPKDVSGLTFGTNGFYLNYANSSDVGNDVSGNNNDWTNVNTVTQVGDTPTVNSNVWNPSESAFSGGTFTNGNRTVQTGTSQYAPAQAGLPISSGKWYTEVVPTATSNIASFQIGITKGLTTANTQQLGSLVNDVGYSGQAGNLFYNGESGSGGQSYGASYAVDDVIGMAIDFDANTITFYKNGASQGVITLPDTSTASTPYFIACNHYDNSSNGTFLLRSLSSDWTGTAPTDHLAIIQDNMPAGESYQTAWSWIKNRDATDNHMLFDRVRGIYNDLHSNTSDTEVTNVNTLQRFLNGGVQVGNDVQVNTVNESYVAWNWYMEATGSGSALTSGSINTTALVDTNLGLSVGTYTGSGSAGTIETGLTNTQFIIVKRRNSAANWPCWHVGLPDDNNLYLDVTNAKSADGLYDTSSNTSTLIAFAGSGGAVNASGGTYSFVAFAPSQFTAIGSYTGNGNANGTFVPTVNSLGIPIQPAWVMIKRTDAANSWQLTDTVRTPDNPSSLILQAQLSNAELDNSDLDIVTGGFKLRATDNIFNNSSGTYVYLAFGTPIIDVDGRIIGGR